MMILLNCRPSEANPESFATWKVQTDLTLVASKMEAHHRHHSFEVLKKATEFLKSRMFSVKSFSLVGDVREEIEHKIAELKVQLLVVGNCGLGAIQRYLFF